MGVMRFLISPAELLGNWPEAYRAYLTSHDGRTHPTRVTVDGNVMTCRRQVGDSGKLHVAWPVAGFDRPIVSTGQLPERDEPYLLSVELARGKLVQVRNQLASWQQQGLPIGADVLEPYRQSHAAMAQAVTRQGDAEAAGELATQALVAAFTAADRLVRTYTRERLGLQHQRYPHLPAALGCDLAAAVPGEGGDWESSFGTAFNVASVPMAWRQIEPGEGEQQWAERDAQVAWCEAARLVVRGGPLLDFAPDGLPEWLGPWEHDFANLQSFVCDFVETAISRYLGRIRLWEIAVNANTGGVLNLDEERRLMLVARAIEVARQVDEESQRMIRIDRPWGEYQARGMFRLTPLQFVDAILRSGVGLSAVNLEIACGYRPRGTAPRDLLDVSRMLDSWGVLGIPLYVTLAFPSAGGPDPQAREGLDVEPELDPDRWSEERQAEWVEALLPLLVAKPPVVGVFWSHFADGVQHDLPHAGLLRPDGAAKPALAKIIAHREAHLK